MDLESLWIDRKYINVLFRMEDEKTLKIKSEKVLQAIDYCRICITDIIEKDSVKKQTLILILKELFNFYEYIELKRKELLKILN